MRDAERLFIHPSATLRDALHKLEETHERVLICVDEQKKLLGVINDGDIRRAILKDAALQAPIEKHLQRRPTVVSDQTSPEDAKKVCTTRTQVIPVVDSHGQVVGCYSYRERDDYVEIQNQRVVVLGLGCVGLTLSVTLADAGFRVYGFDVNESLMARLGRKEAPFYERGLQKSLDRHIGDNLRLVTAIEPGMGDIFVITVGTPLVNGQKQPNLDYLRKAAQSVGRVLQAGNLVLLRSTIPIHCTREIVLPELEKASGLKAGEGFSLAFAPERTAEGRALQELRSNPQIIGGFDRRSAERAADFFNTLTHSTVHVGSLEAAEMCKLLDNTYRDHKFAFINQMTSLAERVGLDLCALVDAVNYGYSRNEIPKPSPGVGGACLSKDPYILSTVFDRYDLDASLLRAARKVNEAGPREVRDKLRDLLAKAGKNINTARIFVIGLAFKGEPETSDLRESTSVWFLEHLPNRANVVAYDARVPAADIEALGLKPVTLEQGFRGADAVVILNNHRSYQDINLHQMFSLMNRPAVFIDSWHIFNPLEIKQYQGVLYGGVGSV